MKSEHIEIENSVWNSKTVVAVVLFFCSIVASLVLIPNKIKEDVRSEGNKTWATVQAVSYLQADVTSVKRDVSDIKRYLLTNNRSYLLNNLK